MATCITLYKLHKILLTFFILVIHTLITTSTCLKCGLNKATNTLVFKDLYTQYTYNVTTLNKTTNISTTETKVSKDPIFNYKNSEFLPFRLYVDYTHLLSQNLSATDFNNTQYLFNQTIITLSNFLWVKRSEIGLQVTSCNNAKISNETLSASGVIADYVIFPMWEAIDKITSAVPGFCLNDKASGRPLAGYIKLNSNIMLWKKNWQDFFQNIILHQMSHLLVFHRQLFEQFIDLNLVKLGIDKVIGTTVVNGIKKTILKTPNVLKVAKIFYNCTTILGIELENLDEGFQNYGHWEARTMLGDYMIGETYDDMVMSEMIPALFTDSGWYFTFAYTGGLHRFGRLGGCDFLNKNCIESQKTQFRNEYCLKEFDPMCTATRSGKGRCYLGDFGKNVEPQYQYFNYPLLVGYDLADYCPVSQSTSTSNDAYFSDNCNYGDYNRIFDFEPNQTILDSLNSTNTVSCFNTFIYDKFANTNAEMKLAANCAVIKCNGTDTESYQVYLGYNKTQPVNCTRQGGRVDFEFNDERPKKGSIYCVDYYHICSRSGKCNTMHGCINLKLKDLKPRMTYKPDNGQSYYNSDTKMFEGNLTLIDDVSFDKTFMVVQKILTMNISEYRSMSLFVIMGVMMLFF